MFAGCSYKGRDYNVGEKFPAGDDCNTCTCKRNGRVDCSDKTCCKKLKIAPIEMLKLIAGYS